MEDQIFSGTTTEGRKEVKYLILEIIEKRSNYFMNIESHSHHFSHNSFVHLAKFVKFISFQ